LIGFGTVANHHLNLATTISVYLFVTLAIAHSAEFAETVEAHGGKISIESDVRPATTFVIAIPNSTEILT
jgi:hypothetical protein